MATSMEHGEPEVSGNFNNSIKIEDNFSKEESISYKELVSELRNLFKEEYHNHEELYDSRDFERIMDTSNDWHCGRYLNHFLMDLDRAFAGIKHTLRWRKEMKINEFNNSHFPKELWLYSPFFKCGKSVDGIRIVYFMGSYYKPTTDPIQTLMRNYFCYYIEQLEIDYPNGEKIYVVFNETNTSIMNFSLETIKWLVSVRDNWPDRVLKILVIGLPFFLRPIVRMIITWLPKEWRNLVKVGTLDILLEEVDNQELPWFFGGLKDATCRLAPAETKWAADMDTFKDKSVLDKLYNDVCFHVKQEQKEHFVELQLEHEKCSKKKSHSIPDKLNQSKLD